MSKIASYFPFQFSDPDTTLPNRIFQQVLRLSLFEQGSQQVQPVKMVHPKEVDLWSISRLPSRAGQDKWLRFVWPWFQTSLYQDQTRMVDALKNHESRYQNDPRWQEALEGLAKIVERPDDVYEKSFTYDHVRVFLFKLAETANREDAEVRLALILAVVNCLLEVAAPDLIRDLVEIPLRIFSVHHGMRIFARPGGTWTSKRLRELTQSSPHREARQEAV